MGAHCALVGARGRIRTDTPSRIADFKSAAAAFTPLGHRKRESGFVTCMCPYTYRILSLIAGSRLLISLKVRAYRSRREHSLYIPRALCGPS